ncbi:hypothetical protein SDC9_123046 [bioreactor metagenome]|uniref:4-oxalocrotonate tautomerase domain-containing protein n=1 Tax=bioreactor metagenome TaxID=1076179 RepID=A0A645CGK9_9ZZZZ
MPMLTFNLPNQELSLDLPSLSQEISAATGIDASRLYLMVRPYAPGQFYLHGGRGLPLVHIAVRRHNGPETIQKLMLATAEAVAKQVQVRPEDIAVYVHPIEDGHIFSRGSIL